MLIKGSFWSKSVTWD